MREIRGVTESGTLRAGNEVKQQEQQEKLSEKSVWGEQEFAAADAKRSGGNDDGVIDAKEMGLDKFIEKADKFIRKFVPNASTRTFFNAIRTIVQKIATAINYKREDIAEEQLEKEIQARKQDASQIEELIKKAKDNANKALSEYNRTELISEASKAALDETDMGHNERAKELKIKDENEGYNKTRKAALDKVMGQIFTLRKSRTCKELEADKSSIPIPAGLKSLENFTITSITEVVGFSSADVKGERRTKTGIQIEKADSLTMTMTYSYVELDNDGNRITKTGSFTKQCPFLPDDIASIEREKPDSEIEYKQEVQRGYTD